MISLSSRLTMESQLLPGVRVHLKKFSVEARSRVVLALAEYRAKANDLYRQMLDAVVIPDDTDETGKVTQPGDPPAVREQKAILRARILMELEALADAYIKPAQLRTYVERFEGVEMDGQPLTVDQLPPEIADEIYEFMEANNGLPPFAGNNSSSPSPSVTPGDGSSPNTTATTAGTKDSGVIATVESTTR
jgi:hypothetical protein